MIVRGERLRFWGLSEVWRIQLQQSEPRSVIVKRGSSEMAEEARRYQDLVIPLQAPAPQLRAVTGGVGAEPVVLVLEDVGPATLEQQPTAEGYQQAVRTLARMRATAARKLAAEPALGAGLRRSSGDFADIAQRAATGLAALRPDLAGSLDEPARALAGRLGRLAGAPDTLVHGDFHAKNLIHARDGTMIAVDWPGAYLHPHLGDLYCLLREADQRDLTHDVATGELPALFAHEAGLDPAGMADRLVTGGLCWTFIALRWIVEEGIHAVPVSRDWIDELVADCRALTGRGHSSANRGVT